MALIIFFAVIAGLLALLVYLHFKNNKAAPKYSEQPIPLRRGLLYWLLGACGIIGFILYQATKKSLGTGIIIDVIVYGICLWLASFAWNIHIKLNRAARGIRLVAFKKIKSPK